LADIWGFFFIDLGPQGIASLGYTQGYNQSKNNKDCHYKFYEERED